MNYSENEIQSAEQPSDKLLKIEVFSLDGKKVAEVQTMEKLSQIDLLKGMYLLKSVDNFGNYKTIKWVKP